LLGGLSKLQARAAAANAGTRMVEERILKVEMFADHDLAYINMMSRSLPLKY
jgi:hypothetical protein